MPRTFDPCCPSGVDDAQYGFILISPGKGAIFISQVWLLAALIYFAFDAADCEGTSEVCAAPVNATQSSPASATCSSERFGGDDDGDDGDDSQCRYWGVNPGTLVSQAISIGSLLSALMMPIFGSIVDHSPHRLLMGKVSTALLVFVNFMQIFLFRATWIFIMLLQAAVQYPLYNCQYIARSAYMCELTKDLGVTLPRINKRDRLWEMAGMWGYLIVVTVAVIVADFGVVDAARLSQALASIIGGSIMWKGWQYMPYRPALMPLREGDSLLLSGFKKIFETAVMVRRDAPQLGRFLVGYVFIEAGTTNVIGLIPVCACARAAPPSRTWNASFSSSRVLRAAADMQVHLCATSNQISLFIMIVMIFIIVGAAWSSRVSAGADGVGRHRAKRAYLGASRGPLLPSEFLLTQVWRRHRALHELVHRGHLDSSALPPRHQPVVPDCRAYRPSDGSHLPDPEEHRRAPHSRWLRGFSSGTVRFLWVDSHVAAVAAVRRLARSHGLVRVCAASDRSLPSRRGELDVLHHRHGPRRG